MERVRKLIHTELPHGEGFLGKGSTVAILDTGVAPHPDLKSRILDFRDFVNGRNASYDDNGHGTHLAGIIGGSGVLSGGRYMGIAPECQFVSLKVLDGMGNGNIESVVRAVDWILKNREKYHIRFLNISIGMMPQTHLSEQRALVEAICALWENNICVVVASGNNRVLLGGSMHVGYSGKGPTKHCVVKPEILAPGTRVVSCSRQGGYVSKSGSSMATAVVTGGLAVMGEIYPQFTPSDMKLFLYSKLRRRKGSSGWGHFDFEELM